MSCIAISLATRGKICCKLASGTSLVTDLVPDATPVVLTPNTFAQDKAAPKVRVDATQPKVCEVDISDILTPELLVISPSSQVPSAEVKEESDEPSIRIRPVEDFAPRIVDKKKKD